MRGWLMLWIVLYHYTYRICNIYPDIYFPFRFEKGGRIGVMFFFIISGFFFFKGILNNDFINIKETLKFIVNKYWRLWLPYIFAITLIFFITQIYELPGRTATVSDYVFNALFLYHPGIEYIDGAHWFIGHLILIQIITSMFLLIKHELRSKAIYIFEMLLCLILIINHIVHDPITAIFVRLFCARNMLYFMLGYNLLRIIMGGDVFFHFMILGILLFYFSFEMSFLLVPLYAILTYLAVNYSTKSKWLQPFISIGNISFEWYLIHQNIGYLIIIALYNKGMTNEIVLLIPILITIIIGVVIHYITTKMPSRLF